MIADMNFHFHSLLLLTQSSHNTFPSGENYRFVFTLPLNSLGIIQVLHCVTNRPDDARQQATFQNHDFQLLLRPLACDHTAQ